MFRIFNQTVDVSRSTSRHPYRCPHHGAMLSSRGKGAQGVPVGGRRCCEDFGRLTPGTGQDTPPSHPENILCLARWEVQLYGSAKFYKSVKHIYYIYIYCWELSLLHESLWGTGEERLVGCYPSSGACSLLGCFSCMHHGKWRQAGWPCPVSKKLGPSWVGGWTDGAGASEHSRVNVPTTCGWNVGLGGGRPERSLFCVKTERHNPTPCWVGHSKVIQYSMEAWDILGWV